MLMHYHALLLEKVADLFPLSMKLDGFSLLVYQIMHQWETFYLQARRGICNNKCAAVEAVFLFLNMQK